MSEWKLKTPVAFLIFNRPKLTELIFEQIAKAKPPVLLVIADGPRAGRVGEVELCQAARTIIDRVNWDCQVHKNYAENNLGCLRRVASGLDWVFDTVEEVIVLEDDCLPHPTFFRFCEELLQKYRTDERLALISGDNFQFGRKRTSHSYFFSIHNHVWGWASWRRAWKNYNVTMSAWPELRRQGWLNSWLANEAGVRYWADIFDRCFQGRIDDWSYAWTFACWRQRQLSALPNVNLITNIGFGPDSTHSTDINFPLANLKSEPIVFPLSHPPRVKVNAKADRFGDRIIFGIQPNYASKLLATLKKTIFTFLLFFISLSLGVIIGEILVRTSGVCETWWEKNVAWWQQNTAWWKKNKNNYISPYAEPSNKTWYWVRTPNAKTNYKLAEFEYPVVTNSLGLRDVEPALARPENEFYLITLGDSFTEGFGAEYESSYPKWLERNLREKCAPLHVRVINGGVCGSDPFYSFTLLRDKLLPYQPNLVTVAINSSDITDLIVRGGEERFLENGGVKFVEPPQDEWLFAGSHLYRLLKRSLGYDWLGLSPSELMAKKERAVNDLIVALGKFNALAMKEHFVFVAILHPANRFEALSQRYSFDANALKRYMEENQIQYVDLMSAFADKAKMGESEVNKLYWQQDGHNNAEGYRIMAEALAAYILDHKLLSSCLTADETVLMSNHF